jgi:hypothetical protein
MALYVWFTSEFYTLNSVKWKIDILGDSEMFPEPVEVNVAGNLFNLSYRGLKDPFDPVLSSELTVTMLVEESNYPEIEEMIGAMSFGVEGKFFCKVYKYVSGAYVFKWGGMMIPDLGTMEDKYYPYELELSFTDGLGRLKDIDFDDEGTLYTGTESLWGILHKLLDKTGNETFDAGYGFIKTCIHYYDANHVYANGTDPLYYTRVKHEAFYKWEDDISKPMMCYDVLLQIMQLFGARIFLADGWWNVFQPNEMANATQTIRYYNRGSSTVYSETGVNYRISTFNTLTGGSHGYLAPFKKVTKRYEYTQSQQGNNLIPTQSSYTTVVSFLNGVAGGGTEKLNFAGTINETLQLTDPYLPPFMVKYRLRIVLTLADSSKRYLSNGANGLGPYVWETSSTRYVTVWTNITHHGSALHELTTVGFFTAVIPTNSSGTFEFDFDGFYDYDYQPISGSGITHSYTCDNFKVVQLLGNNINSEGSQFYFVTNSDLLLTKDYNFPNALIGDGHNQFSVGALQSSNNIAWVNTTLWGIKSATKENKIHNLMLAQVMAGLQLPTPTFTGDIVSTTYDATRTLSMFGNVYYPLNVNFMAAMDTWSGMWFKVAVSLPSSYTIGNTGNFTPSLLVNPNGFTGSNGVQAGAMASNLMQMMSLVQTDASYVVDDVATSISTGTFTAPLKTGDKVQLVNRTTGQAVELTVDADYPSGGVDIAVQSHTFTEDYPSGSFIVVKPADMLSQGQMRVIRYEGLNAAGSVYTLTDLVPVGWMIDKITLVETASSTDIVKIGTTSGGNEILGTTIAADSIEVHSTGWYFSESAAQTIYVDTATTLNLTFVLIKLL